MNAGSEELRGSVELKGDVLPAVGSTSVSSPLPNPKKWSPPQRFDSYSSLSSSGWLLCWVHPLNRVVGYSNKNILFWIFTLVPQIRGLTKLSICTAKPVRNTVLNLLGGTSGYIPLPCNMLRRVNSFTGTYGQPFLSFFLSHILNLLFHK